MFAAYDGHDTIHAGGGNDLVCAGGQGDTIHLGPGDDVFDAAGSHWLIDTIDYSGAPQGITVDLAARTVTSGGFVDRIRAGVPRIVGSRFGDDFKGSAAIDLFQGGSGADTFRTGAGNDHVKGGPGDDSIWTKLGDDHIDGGDGSDDGDAGGGNDTCVNTETVDSCEG